LGAIVFAPLSSAAVVQVMGLPTPITVRMSYTLMASGTTALFMDNSGTPGVFASVAIRQEPGRGPVFGNPGTGNGLHNIAPLNPG
jgi:hypothetical protein